MELDDSPETMFAVKSPQPVQLHQEVALQTFKHSQSSRIVTEPDLHDTSDSSAVINISPLFLPVLVRHETAPRHLLSPPLHGPPSLLSRRGKERKETEMCGKRVSLDFL